MTSGGDDHVEDSVPLFGGDVDVGIPLIDVHLVDDDHVLGWQNGDVLAAGANSLIRTVLRTKLPVTRTYQQLVSVRLCGQSCFTPTQNSFSPLGLFSEKSR